MFIPVEEPYLKANAGQPSLTAVGRNAAHPEKALELLELVNTDQNCITCLLTALRGKHYTKNSDGKVVINQGWRVHLKQRLDVGNQFNAYIQEGQDDDVWIKTEEMNDSARRSPVFGFQFDTDPVKTEVSQITSVTKEYGTMDRGAEDPTPIYDEFVAKMKEAGIEKVKEEFERQLDDWKAAQ